MMQNEARPLADTALEPVEKGFDQAALLSVGGIVAALGAATCCVVPFVLFFAGISGAWIGNLTAFEPYQPVFVTIALACLGYGFPLADDLDLRRAEQQLLVVALLLVVPAALLSLERDGRHERDSEPHAGDSDSLVPSERHAGDHA